MKIIEWTLLILGISLLGIGSYSAYLSRKAYKTATKDLNRLIDIIDKMAGIYGEDHSTRRFKDG